MSAVSTQTPEEMMYGYGVIPGGGNAFSRAQQKFQGSAKPSQELYGVMPTAYAGALAEKTKDPLFGGAHLMAMQMQAGGELDRYEEMLRQAAINEQAISAGNNTSAERVAATNQLGNYAKHGLLQGAYDVIPGLDPVLAARSDAQAGATAHAEQYATVGKGVKDHYDAGIKTDPALAANMGMSVTESQPAQVRSEYGVFGAGPGGFNPTDTNKFEANVIDREELASRERIAAANNATDRATAGAKGGGSDVITTQYLMNPDGTLGRPFSQTVKSKGDASNRPQGEPNQFFRFREGRRGHQQ